MILTFLLAGCGESSKLYPASKADGVYFSVPKNWNGLSSEALNKYEKKSNGDKSDSRQSLVKWQVAYSPTAKIKISEVFSLKPPKSPLVFARIRDLTTPEINDFSYNSLRNVIVPVTDLAAGNNAGAPDFKVLLDEEVVQKGGRGVHTVFSFSLDGIAQTFNQTVLTSNDRATLLIFVARCESSCYAKNQKQIEEIVKSYTVRGAQ
jgi:hypothetical protein